MCVFGVAHLPCGKRIVTCSSDGSLRIWDLESGAQIGEEWRDGEHGVRTIALSPDGETLVSGSCDGTVRLWDVEMGKVVLKWKGHNMGVTSACWSSNGERVVTGSYGGMAYVWDVKSGESIEGLNPIYTGHNNMSAVRYSPGAKMIATGGFHDHAVKIWDANSETGEPLSEIELERSIYSLAWTSNEKKLFAGSTDGSIRVIDTATWQQIAILEGHADAVNSVTLFQNDRLLASTSYDKTARFWNLDTNLQVGPPLQHENFVICAAFSADGKLLSTACYDNNVYVWAVPEDLLSVSVNAPF
jgi:WD40 repeat protein